MNFDLLPTYINFEFQPQNSTTCPPKRQERGRGGTNAKWANRKQKTTQDRKQEGEIEPNKTRGIKGLARSRKQSHPNNQGFS